MATQRLEGTSGRQVDISGDRLCSLSEVDEALVAVIVGFVKRNRGLEHVLVEVAGDAEPLPAPARRAPALRGDLPPVRLLIPGNARDQGQGSGKGGPPQRPLSAVSVCRSPQFCTRAAPLTRPHRPDRFTVCGEPTTDRDRELLVCEVCHFRRSMSSSPLLLPG